MKSILIFIFAMLLTASEFAMPCPWCKLCASNENGSCSGESSLCSDPATGWAGFCQTRYWNKQAYCTCAIDRHEWPPTVIYQ